MLHSLIPAFFLIVLTLLSVVPTRLPYYAGVAPMLTVVGVSCWSITKPTLLKPIITFFIGIFEDLLTGAFLGFNTLVLLCVYAIALTKRRFFLGKSFIGIWWFFSYLALVATLLKWCLFALLTGTIVYSGEILFSYLITVLIYPVFGLLFFKSWTASTKEM